MRVNCYWYKVAGSKYGYLEWGYYVTGYEHKCCAELFPGFQDEYWFSRHWSLSQM
jgi:hypothetical protein